MHWPHVGAAGFGCAGGAPNWRRCTPQIAVGRGAGTIIMDVTFFKKITAGEEGAFHERVLPTENRFEHPPGSRLGY